MMTTGTYTGLHFAEPSQVVTTRFEGFDPVVVSLR